MTDTPDRPLSEILGPEDFEGPEPTPEPETELVDSHTGPLDDDEDGRWLECADPRRIDAEARRGRPFDQDRED